MFCFVKSPLFALALLASCKALAGGPLIIEGTDGHTPVRYSPATVKLHFDVGTLGSLSNTQADALILEAFALWNNVTSSALQLQQGDDLAADIDISNYMNLISDGSANHPGDTDNLNPLIYDDDGTITDDLFGVNASDDIAGFAASGYYLKSSTYEEGYVVLNGKLELTGSDLVGIVTHEIGHFIGLDHSQLDIDNNETTTGSPAVCSTKTSQDEYPVMYPFSCRLEKTLHVDDIAAISALYPTASITSDFGQINGVFIDTADKPIPGANLWVENTLTGAHYSIVSDYLLQGTGFFSIYLPAGDYTLHANSINPIFYGASSVGPYALSQNDISFQSPHPIAAVGYQGNTPGFEQNISVVTGKGTQVTFISDGSGETSMGEIVMPVAPSSSSNDSGVFSMTGLLILITALVCLRRKTVGIKL